MSRSAAGNRKGYGGGWTGPPSPAPFDDPWLWDSLAKPHDARSAIGDRPEPSCKWQTVAGKGGNTLTSPTLWSAPPHTKIVLLFFFIPPPRYRQVGVCTCIGVPAPSGGCNPSSLQGAKYPARKRPFSIPSHQHGLYIPADADARLPGRIPQCHRPAGKMPLALVTPSPSTILVR